MMVEPERCVEKSTFSKLHEMQEIDQASGMEGTDENIQVPLKSVDDAELQAAPEVVAVANGSMDKDPVPPPSNDGAKSGSAPKKKEVSEMDMMKERFAKLLLGEDMSGGGKGVSSALALSNAITNLAASVFGEQSKLEPMSPERKARWKKEIGWLLSVTDYIVEFVASEQKSKDGTSMEIMTTQQRKDLLMNIPALRKLDAMLLATLDNFTNQHDFWYVSKDADESEKGVQRGDKWWLPTVKVPPNGLSEESRQFLQKQKESVNQVLKASMAINAQILSDIDIPESYIESLPRNGKASLGELIYRSITVEFFDPQQFLSTMDLSSEHKVLDLKNRIEASIVIWKRKMHQKDAKSGWGLAVSAEKRELFEERAETILLLLKHQFPGLPQSSLDISKIQFNRDVGMSVLESYSRVLETLANTVMSRIEDVLYADSVAQNPSLAVVKVEQPTDPLPSPTISNPPNPEEEAEKLSPAPETPTSMTLSDFMGWKDEPSEPEVVKSASTANVEAPPPKDEEDNGAFKYASSTLKKYLYIDKIDMTGLKSPIARH
ncbi:rop guanine nucleotide exchange factor 9 [Sesamum indicum]|uniref:Rop guanine nucleotide exchange factor 9 n=1 Tax=Sesamum indicum TaxID=4182 RepID=A0A6I9T5J4_SESIN|nr:rop guanine nucleotide exchange factor 9 [Sesamum indicum]